LRKHYVNAPVGKPTLYTAGCTVVTLHEILLKMLRRNSPQK